MHGYSHLYRNIFQNARYFSEASPKLVSGSIDAVSAAFSRLKNRTRAPRAVFPIEHPGDASSDETDLYGKARHSIVRLVELLVEEAHAARASDVHVDPHAHALLVRFRIDGCLLDAYELPSAIHSELLSRIKILADLRTDEHYAAQDGRFRLALANGPPIDIRVSIAPSYHGENAVLRLLPGQAQPFSLEDLSFTPENQLKITRALKRPHGMILVTGPTGSGKTTTMYALVQMVNEPGISTVTLEDPVEYAMPRVSQIQINPKIGLTFGAGLRSVLRQDPDVIMVGEIRDGESASLAVNAALTGHRLLSTLHTTDAIGTITRLQDIKIEPYLIASTVVLSIAQRLARRICDSCRAVHAVGREEMRCVSELAPDFKIPRRAHFFCGVGCERCRGTGYYGRVGVHEVLEISPALREAILVRASASELRALALAEGMIPMASDALAKASAGMTTIAEALKTAYE